MHGSKKKLGTKFIVTSSFRSKWCLPLLLRTKPSSPIGIVNTSASVIIQVIVQYMKGIYLFSTQ